MIKINVLLFGIATDLVGTSSLELELPENISVKAFKEILQKQYQNLKQLNTYAIAVNESYASDATLVCDKDTVAIIPPVSGG